MTTPNSAAVGSAATSAWAWPLNVNRFRRRDRLSQVESDALQGLGFDLLRLDRDRDHPGWQAILRLTAPLDETLAVLHWHPDTVFQRRFARYATAIVLHHCGELGRDFWSWSTREWADLLRPQQLRQRFAGQSACRLVPTCSPMPICWPGSPPSTWFGPFARHTLAQRVFGADLVEEAIEPVRAVLAGWGYRAANLESMVCTLLLLNRSPMLTDLSSPVLGRLRSDKAIERHFHGRHLHGVHRALAALGHTVRHRHRDTGTGPSPSPAPPRAGRTRSNAGTPPRRSNPAPATPTASFWPRSADGWRPNTPTSPGLPTGPARPARPGSPQSTACVSAITSNRRIGVTAAPNNSENRCHPRRNVPTFASPAPSSATSRTGTGSRAGSTPHEHWKLRAASGPCKDPIRG